MLFFFKTTLKMKISIIGTGYVGLVTGVCLSNVGNKVICLDIDKEKIALLNSGESTIYEHGLSTKLKAGISSGNLSFTTDYREAINSSDIIFIAVGTPSLDSGETDLSYVLSAANKIARNLDNDKIVVVKSTVPVGTNNLIRDIINQHMQNNNLDYNVKFISNPEFLKEGKAIKEFESPDRIVVGHDDSNSLDVIKELYRPFNLHHNKIIEMDIKSAEFTKYAANAMLATKISFINEMANICEKVGADINNVRMGIGSDSRIGFDFIYPGIGFGGSCFPKDLKSIQDFSKKAGYSPEIINSVINVNFNQRNKFAQNILNVLKLACSEDDKINVGVWGLSFKPETDDIRESPSIDIIKFLLSNNVHIKVFDPIAIDNAKKEIYHNNLKFCTDMYDTVKSVDALVLCTEWSDFRSPNFNKMKSIMRKPIVFDGKNIFSNHILEDCGFRHYQVGVGV